MKQWGIRNQVLVLTLLPALLIALVLTVYFTLSQLNYISNTLDRHGRTIASQISPTAEYAVFSGNIEPLRNILNHTLMSDKDVIKVTITNDNDETLLSLAVEPQQKEYPGRCSAYHRSVPARQFQNSRYRHHGIQHALPRNRDARRHKR